MMFNKFNIKIREFPWNSFNSASLWPNISPPYQNTLNYSPDYNNKNNNLVITLKSASKQCKINVIAIYLSKEKKKKIVLSKSKERRNGIKVFQ